MQSGLIVDAQSYVSILDGSPLSVIYEVDLSQNDLVETENKDMLDGVPVITMMIDNHPLHVRKHSQLLNDPTIRRNNQSVAAILQHIDEHVRMQAEIDPSLQAMLMTGKAPQLAPGASPSPGGQAPEPSPEIAQNQAPIQAPTAEDLNGRAG